MDKSCNVCADEVKQEAEKEAGLTKWCVKHVYDDYQTTEPEESLKKEAAASFDEGFGDDDMFEFGQSCSEPSHHLASQS